MQLLERLGKGMCLRLLNDVVGCVNELIFLADSKKVK
jgi:hypothetical protein